MTSIRKYESGAEKNMWHGMLRSMRSSQAICEEKGKKEKLKLQDQGTCGTGKKAWKTCHTQKGLHGTD